MLRAILSVGRPFVQTPPSTGYALGGGEVRGQTEMLPRLLVRIPGKKAVSPSRWGLVMGRLIFRGFTGREEVHG